MRSPHRPRRREQEALAAIAADGPDGGQLGGRLDALRHHVDARQLGQHRRLVELHRVALIGPVTNGLAVRPDGAVDPDVLVVDGDGLPGEPGRDDAFRLLFQYIAGANGGSDDTKRIAMTTPVLMERGPAGADDSMAFVLPRDMPEVPAPAAADVTLASMQGGRFAVHRFHAARPDPEMETKAEEALRDWMRGRQLASAGQPLFAYFDPPWIPRWFRRNEVMLRVAPQP